MDVRKVLCTRLHLKSKFDLIEVKFSQNKNFSKWKAVFNFFFQIIIFQFFQQYSFFSNLIRQKIEKNKVQNFKISFMYSEQNWFIPCFWKWFNFVRIIFSDELTVLTFRAVVCACYVWKFNFLFSIIASSYLW